MNSPDFVVVGSSGGGGTIAWVLAKAGFDVLLLEQGSEYAKPLVDDAAPYNSVLHDEYRHRLERPDPKRRLRGDYNTIRASDGVAAAPFDKAWTASVLGGGSILWGTWSFRPLPIDFGLATHFKEQGQSATLRDWGYAVTDWPVAYGEFEPYFNLAETLLAVCGDRKATNDAIRNSDWYREFSTLDSFRNAGNWFPKFPFPSPPYPRTPVGDFFYQAAEHGRLSPVGLPTGIVAPGSDGYATRDKLDTALRAWNGERPSFWTQDPAQLWSDRVRSACNLCGFCGEYLCWGKDGPKSGTRFNTLRELADLPNAEVVTDAKVFEIEYDSRLRRATGVRYLDVSDPDRPVERKVQARYVVVSCGAVQSARLLLLSGPPAGLGNRYGQVGRNAMFHLFGLGLTCTLPEGFQGVLRSEFGHTGNTTSFADYFVKDDRAGEATAGKWWKAGTLASAAKKNPLENADGKLRGSGAMRQSGSRALLAAMEKYNRSLDVRLTGDDLPMPRNRVDLDPVYVDEYGLPVARITRDFGPAEKLMFDLMKARLPQHVGYFKEIGLISDASLAFSGGIQSLIGDHQMGTCRMGDDPTTSVVDRNCRLHDVPNVFVVDSSFFPTGFGLNPMVTVVANALRIGTWITEEAHHGSTLA